jgi:fatty-acyl-CoA synthase
LGLRKDDRVATLCWNHHAHLEAYFGVPAAGGVLHTLNLRLSPDELGWIAGNAQDRFLIVDDVLLPLYRQLAPLHKFEKVIVFSFSGAPVPDDLIDYEALLATGDAGGLPLRARMTRTTRSPCATPRAPPAAQGRGLFAPLDRPAHAGGQPG